MKIDLTRLAKLAGLDSSQTSSLNESAAREPEETISLNDLQEMPEDDMGEDADKEIEVDEKMLVQELRRAKKMINESKRVKALKEQNLQEAELKNIISSEIENVLKDLNLNSSWVYGGNKPKRSKPGHTAQGSYLKGIGFK